MLTPGCIYGGTSHCRELIILLTEVWKTFGKRTHNYEGWRMTWPRTRGDSDNMESGVSGLKARVEDWDEFGEVSHLKGYFTLRLMGGGSRQLKVIDADIPSSCYSSIFVLFLYIYICQISKYFCFLVFMTSCLMNLLSNVSPDFRWIE